ncbi:HNH endonuclease family protein [Streptosporangium sp. CA-115845]|uniref:HNH endonuclease family protein n=1 Tax=Streptosporangium sp. CA-115845 TaxID=3240071 RepID=UPI003D94D598
MSAVLLSGVLSTAAPLTASAAVGAPVRQAAAASMPTPITAAAARTALSALTVATPRSMAGYSRAKFPHWMSQSSAGAGCDTREVVLARDGQAVKRDAECRATSGTWKSLYDSRRYTRAASVDIDHMVPLANAWRSGADAWSTQRRRAFANDLTRPQLIAVSAASNRSKGDQSPDQWQPPARGYWCLYARAWIQVKKHYALTVTAAEKTTLRQMLGTCPAPADPAGAE